LAVLTRPDALDPAHADAVRGARLGYGAGASPMQLRSVRKDSRVRDALLGAWEDGPAVAGTSAGAQVLCDRMVDPRGGARTLGLGLIGPMALIPHHDSWSEDKEKRTLQIARASLPIAGVPERTALLRGADGTWRAAGVGEVVVH